MVLDNGVVDRVELSWIIDLATRAVPAAVLRPTTRAVDAALLLARAMTPEPMRPGWSDALRMSRSVLPHRRLTQIDQRLQDAAASTAGAVARAPRRGRRLPAWELRRSGQRAGVRGASRPNIRLTSPQVPLTPHPVPVTRRSPKIAHSATSDAARSIARRASSKSAGS